MYFTPLTDTKARRRIYLMRHGEVCYVDGTGIPFEDSVSLKLTERGVGQAERVAKELSGITFDRIICSGMPRTIQTAQLVSKLPEEAIEIQPGLREIIEGDLTAIPESERVSDVVYSLERAAEPGKKHAGGDRFDEFSTRVLDSFEEIAHSPDWTYLLIVAHGIVNRLILSYLASGTRDGALKGIARFEQDPCCLNILDLDYDNGKIIRSYVRLVNLTPYDLIKGEIVLTTGEISYYDWLGPFNEISRK